MHTLSKKKNYEHAAKYRDQIKILDIFSKKQTKITQKFSNKDIIHISHEGNYSIGFVMRVRNGLIVSKDQYNIANINFKINLDYFDNFLVQYYNLTMDRWYYAADGNIWLSFPSSERNKIDEESYQ